MITLRQLRSVVAVYEEASFTRAAHRENATQSGISQHVGAVETALGVSLFERGPDGVQPTAVGRRYYNHAVQVLRQLELAAVEAREASTGISGTVRAGLMPMFTRAALPPVLDRFLEAYPEIDAQIIEGYSGALTDMVRAETLDFALVPAGSPDTGLTVTHLVRDREMLVSGPDMALQHGTPVRLSDLPPLNMVVPTRTNVRRDRLDAYFRTHGIRLARLLEMDAMMGTLELVARGHWVSVLPGLICVSDMDGETRHVSPLDDPPLYSDFVMIEPSRRPLSPQARLFFAAVRTEVDHLSQSM
ncbi:MAG: LysR family transcriptional regulator [Silicimonas sp.]|nr:LysR family transcriptional regulator [Silicimonas sp.]